MGLPIAAVLLDVGGTLWPDRWPARASDGERHLARMSALLPWLGRDRCVDLIGAVQQRGSELDACLLQDNHALVRQAARRCGLEVDRATSAAICRALVVPADARVALFAGAVELLDEIEALGLACVVLSNAFVRDADAYRRDFEALGVADRIDAIVTSVDAGFRKPHPRAFAAAVQSAGCAADRCVMVGNSERNDVAPAVALGMRAVRVAIEEPLPGESAAQAVAGSLEEVAAILRGWVVAARA